MTNNKININNGKRIEKSLLPIYNVNLLYLNNYLSGKGWTPIFYYVSELMYIVSSGKSEIDSNKDHKFWMELAFGAEMYRFEWGGSYSAYEYNIIRVSENRTEFVVGKPQIRAKVQAKNISNENKNLSLVSKIKKFFINFFNKFKK